MNPLLGPRSANFIGGAWCRPREGDTYTRVAPYGGHVLGDFAWSGPADVNDAVAAAKEALPDWSRAPMASRAAYLRAAADVLCARTQVIAQLLAREVGKPLVEAETEVRRGVEMLRYYAGLAYSETGSMFQQGASGGSIHTFHRPRGVVGLITPWNFPLAIPIWKMAPALVFGNTVVLKHSEESPWVTQALFDCLTDAGLPRGVINSVGGGSAVGEALVRHEDVAAVSFTGSSLVGNAVKVAATEHGKPVQLEMGGQNALIVSSSANLPRAADAAFVGAYAFAGQKCTATRRVIVHQDVYEKFRELLLERMACASVGDPESPNVEVGPVINGVQQARILEAIAKGVGEGAKTLLQLAVPDKGGFVPPTLFEDVPEGSFLSREEVFGPVSSLYKFSRLEEAISQANSVEYGLSMALYSRDIEEVAHFLRAAHVGVLHVNSPTTGTDVHVPFGGVKASGWGPHEQGQAAKDFYTSAATAYIDAG